MHKTGPDRAVTVSDCEQCKRLLDAYLLALPAEIALRSAGYQDGIPPPELSAAHERLVTARKRYWAHVQLHIQRED